MIAFLPFSPAIPYHRTICLGSGLAWWFRPLFAAATDESRRFLNQNRAKIVAFQCPSQGLAAKVCLPRLAQGSLAKTLQTDARIDPAVVIMTAM
jgi:hypothetical protein